MPILTNIIFIYDSAHNLKNYHPRLLKQKHFKLISVNNLIKSQPLQTAVKLMQTLFENSTDGISILSEKGNVQYVSASIKNILGYSHNEAKKINPYVLVHADDHITVKEAIDKALERPGIKIRGITVRMRHKNGQWRWIEATMTNLLHDPAINGILNNFHDVTEKKVAEIDLLNAQRLYAFNSQINHTIVHVHDEQTLFKEACRIAVKTGKFKKAWIGLTDTSCKKINLTEQCGVYPGDEDLFKNMTYDENSVNGLVITSGRYYVCNDIMRDPLLMQWQPYTLDRGYSSCMVLPIMKKNKVYAIFNLWSGEAGFFNSKEIFLLKEATGDISFALDVFEKEKERVAAIKKMQDSERHMKQAQEVAHIGSWVLNFATGIAVWSEEALRIYGLTAGEYMQTYESWLAYVHPDDVEYVLKVNAEAQETFSDSSLFHRIIRKDGTVRFVHSRAHFEFDNNGTPIGLYGTSHDITEQKNAEMERTAMITDLLQRNKDLEQFSYIVSHNLRAPVANIIGLTDLLNETNNKEDEQMILEGLSFSAKKLDDVIKDINQTLQIKHQVNEYKEPVKFQLLLDDIKLSIGNLLQNEDAIIMSDFSAVDEIRAIKSHLYSIFFNLISNSIKFHKPGKKPIIEIWSSIDEDKINLFFKDNGLGMDLAKKGKELFGLYKRFHDHIDGKGMGLYLVKTQVEKLGGKITVESAVNKGTCFTISFNTENKKQ